MLKEILTGIIIGTASGVTPGIHVNTLAGVCEERTFWALFAMGLTHTFLDAFPSTFLGVPDGETALSILPAHRMVLAGRGREVIWIALISSLLALPFVFLMLPLYSLLAEGYKASIGKAGAVLLIGLLIFTERRKNRVKALVIILLSGRFGLIVFREMSLNEPFYHVFTGLFGVPVILTSLKTKALPEQDPAELPNGMNQEQLRMLVGFSAVGTLLGMVSSLLPGFTASIGATIATLFSKDDKKFLSAVYSINTANYLFGIFNYSLTGRTRNGIAVTMAKNSLHVSSTEALLFPTLFIGVTAVFIGWILLRVYVKIFQRLNYRLVSTTVLAFLLFISFYFDGPLGLWTLLTASLIGYLPLMLRVKRTNCMGVLLLPVLGN